MKNLILALIVTTLTMQSSPSFAQNANRSHERFESFGAGTQAAPVYWLLHIFGSVISGVLTGDALVKILKQNGVWDKFSQNIDAKKALKKDVFAIDLNDKALEPTWQSTLQKELQAINSANSQLSYAQTGYSNATTVLNQLEETNARIAGKIKQVLNGVADLSAENHVTILNKLDVSANERAIAADILNQKAVVQTWHNSLVQAQKGLGVAQEAFAAKKLRYIVKPIEGGSAYAEIYNSPEARQARTEVESLIKQRYVASRTAMIGKTLEASVYIVFLVNGVKGVLVLADDKSPGLAPIILGTANN